MSFQQGLSGLNGASKNLDVIGNNVANSSTVGFKSSQAQFSDVYAASLAGGAGTQIGLGVQVATVAQQFTQGNITTSSNPLDVAINGKGFFRMSNNGSITYSRNGQFQLDKSGFIVDSGGRRLTGFGVTKTPDPNNPTQTIDSPNTGVPVDLQISPNAQSNPQATTSAIESLNLDSRLTPPTIAFNSTAANPIPDPQSYNSATSIQVYDSLGNPHNVTYYFQKANTAATVPPTSTWNMYVQADGKAIDTSTLASPQPLNSVLVNGNDQVNPTFPVPTITATPVLQAGSTLTATAPTVPTPSSTTRDAVTLTFTDATHYTVTDTTTGQTLASGIPYVAGAINYNGWQTTLGGVPVAGDKINFTSSLAPVTPTQLVFDATGKLKNYVINGVPTPNANTPLNLSLDMTQLGATGTVTPLAFTADFKNTTQFGADFSVSTAQQNGFTSGQLSGFTISSNGGVLARYTNGQSSTLGFVRLENFPNPQGLTPVGNNQWVQTSASGQPVDGTPGTGSFGVVQSGATEDSNVDLTKELVDMITAQRVYQANAQTIKTQDAVLNTLVNLR